MSIVVVAGVLAGMAILLLWWPSSTAPPRPKPVPEPKPLRPPAPLSCLRLGVAWPGASAFEVEHSVLEPLISQLSAIPGVEEVRGIATEGEATLSIGIAGGEGSPHLAVRDALRPEALPEGAEPPILWPTPDTPALVYAIRPEQDPLTLPRAHDRLVRRPIERIPGVARVEPCGLAEPRVEITLDGRRLTALDLRPDDVIRALRVPHLQRGTAEDLGDLPVAAPAGQPIRVADLATIAVAAAPPACVLMLGGRRRAGGVVHLQRRDADRSEAMAEVRRVLAAAEPLVIDVFELRPETTTLGADTPERDPERRAQQIAAALPETPTAIVFATAGHLRITLPGASPEQASHALQRLQQAPNLEAWPPGAPAVIARLEGPDLAILADLASRATVLARAVSNVRAVRSTATQAPELQIRPHRDALARLGLQTLDVVRALRLARDGIESGVVGPDHLPVVVRLPETDDLGAILVHSPSSGAVPISRVAELSYQPSPATIHTIGDRREVLVIVSLPAEHTDRVRGEVRAALRRGLEVPGGYRLHFEPPRCPL